MRNITKLSLTTAAALTFCLGTVPVQASSHREAPSIAINPAVDGTDFYMFQSYEAGRFDAGTKVSTYTTLIADYNPLQDPFGGPNYFAMDPNAIYEIHLDNTGDAKEDLTFQFKFTNTLAGGSGTALAIGGSNVAIPLQQSGSITAGNDAALNFKQSYTVTLIRGDRRKGTRQVVTNHADASTSFVKPEDYIGTKTFPAYAAYANQYVYNIDIPGCTGQGKLFVGQRKEPFVVNLGKIFDLVNAGSAAATTTPGAGSAPIERDSAPGANDNGGYGVNGLRQNTANNTIASKNITSLELEVPTSCLVGSGNGVIGGWTTASLPQAKLLNPSATFALPQVYGGAYTQVSRLGMPLVNEVVIGLKDKDHFNASKPMNDGQFLTYVTNPTLPALLDILFRGAVLGTNSTVNIAPATPRNDLVAAFLTGFQGLNQLATVTPSEMLRLNTATPITTPVGTQSTFGVAGGDLAGFPNGRRPGDDVVDVSLRVVMGALCHPLPVLGQLSYCGPSNAPAGTVAFTDGAPVHGTDYGTTFPYLNTPLAGSAF